MFAIQSSKIKRSKNSETFIIVFKDQTMSNRLEIKIGTAQCKIRLNSVDLLAKEAIFYIKNMSFDVRFTGRIKRIKRKLHELIKEDKEFLKNS